MPTDRQAPLALQVTLRWRDDVLAVEQLSGDALASLDALAPIPRVLAPGADPVFARVARGAAFAIAPAGGAAAIRRAGGALELVEGPAEIPLGAGDVVELRFGDFTVEALAGVPETLPRERRRASGGLGGLAVAAIAHAIVLGLAAHDAMASNADARDDERVREVAGLLASAELRARAGNLPPVQSALGSGEGSESHARHGDGRKGGGAKAEGKEGAMGNRGARPGAHQRYAVPAETKNDPAMSTSRAEAIADARSFGMIGLLAQGPAVPSATFADDAAHGADAIAARGDLWGRMPGESFGEGGLGLTGIGEGGDGSGQGIGLGVLGLLGHTDGRVGPGTGGDGSFGLIGGGSWSRISGTTHHVRVLHGGHYTQRGGYRCTLYGRSISGRLPAEVIRRIVRQNFGRFRACYEDGLRRNPELEGTVRARFVIGRDGAVSNTADGGSTLPDPAVVSCVVRAFYGLSFPQPEGGIVTVTYPIVFSRT